MTDPSVNLEEFDKHIASVQSQITFLASWLDSIHGDNDDDWLASDIITLKGGTSMLYDKWRHLRRRMVKEGVAVLPGSSSAGNGYGNGEGKKDKRLSIEGVTNLNLESRSACASRSATPMGNTSLHSGPAPTPTVTGTGTSSRKRKSVGEGQLTPPAQSRQRHTSANQPREAPQEREEDTNTEYEVQYVDITQIVNRRLREARLRQLTEGPGTSQKRKRDHLDLEDEGRGAEGGANGEDGGDEKEQDLLLASMMSPQKKLKTVGCFEEEARGDAGGGVVKKRVFSGAGEAEGENEGGRKEEGRGRSKRRKRM